MKDPARLVFLGPPGAGKGTQAALLSERLSIPSISTGLIFREAMQSGSPLGLRVKTIYDSGALVSDDLVLEIVAERLLRTDCENGFLFDGFPRTLHQGETFAKWCDETKKQLQAVIYFHLPEAIFLERLEDRAKKENRSDDTPETRKERVRVYREQTEPLVEFYKNMGILIQIDASQSIQNVTKLIAEALHLPTQS
jgi:adenylate kinase